MEKQFVTFYIGDKFFGIDIRFVKEINTNTDIMQVPLTSNSVKGLLNVRGQVVLVMDIPTILGDCSVNITDESSVIILKTIADLTQSNIGIETNKIINIDDKPIGIISDNVAEVITTDDSYIEKAPTHLDKGHIDMYDGIIDMGKEMLIILNVNELCKE